MKKNEQLHHIRDNILTFTFIRDFWFLLHLFKPVSVTVFYKFRSVRPFANPSMRASVKHISQFFSCSFIHSSQFVQPFGHPMSGCSHTLRRSSHSFNKKSSKLPFGFHNLYVKLQKINKSQYCRKKVNYLVLGQDINNL